MSEELRVIKKTIDSIEDSKKSLLSSVNKTIDALDKEIKFIKRRAGLCYESGCYNYSSHPMGNINEDWLCEKHWNEFNS